MIDIQLLITKRTECGLSQRQLAKHAGVNRETIRRLEHGADPSQLPLGVVLRIAETLRTPLASLLIDSFTSTAPGECTDSTADLGQLDHDAARLLRRICRGEDVRRTLSHVERTLVLPNLLNRRLVLATPNGLELTPEVSHLLAPQRAASECCSVG